MLQEYKIYFNEEAKKKIKRMVMFREKQTFYSKTFYGSDFCEVNNFDINLDHILVGIFWFRCEMLKLFNDCSLSLFWHFSSWSDLWLSGTVFFSFLSFLWEIRIHAIVFCWLKEKKCFQTRQKSSVTNLFLV